MPNLRGGCLFTVAGVAVGLFGTVVNELAFHQCDSYLIVYKIPHIIIIIIIIIIIMMMIMIIITEV